ncbi:MAG: ferric reductase-like transmembrane domain-containing protein [Actinomycetota bacterium]
MIALASKAYWYLTRGTGVVTMLLVTATVVLGIANSVRWSPDRTPRFVLQRVHRNISLMVLAFLAIHITTAVLDSFAPIKWMNAIVPFTAAYRPIWLGLGSVALDLLLAVLVTSLLRARMKVGTWKVVHWFSYGAWAAAIFHGIGVGSDANQVWMLALVFASVLAVAAAALWRVARGWERWEPGRVAMTVGAFVIPAIIFVWTLNGPLRAGWAARSGTPAKLLAARSTHRSTVRAVTQLVLPGTATFDGTSSVVGGGSNVVLTINGKTTGRVPLGVQLTIHGTQQTSGLGVNSGTVILTPPQHAAVYRGAVTGLQQGALLASLDDGQGDRINVTILLSAPTQGSARGQIAISNAGAGA